MIYSIFLLISVVTADNTDLAFTEFLDVSSKHADRLDDIVYCSEADLIKDGNLDGRLFWLVCSCLLLVSFKTLQKLMIIVTLVLAVGNIQVMLGARV